MSKHSRVWSLQEAKAKFSEVVRRAQTEGPQTVTVHGKNVVTISAVSPEKRRRRKLTGADLVRRCNPVQFRTLKFPSVPARRASGTSICDPLAARHQRNFRSAAQAAG